MLANSIFISYRRDDTRHVAARLRSDLSTRFGKERVFRDIDGIEPGSDFAVVLKTALSSCSVLLALVGDRWLSARNAKGHARIADADDWTAREIGEALERKIRVIPILVEGAAPLTELDLPSTLRPLARLQALPLADARWRGDLQSLIEVIERIDAAAAPPPVESPAVPQAKHRMTVLAVAAVVAAAALLIFVRPHKPDSPDTQATPSPTNAEATPAGAGPAPLSRMDAMRGRSRGVPGTPNISGVWLWTSGNEEFRLDQEEQRFEIRVFAIDTKREVGKGNGYLEDSRLSMVLAIQRGTTNHGNLNCELDLAPDMKSMQGTCGLADKEPIALRRAQ